MARSPPNTRSSRSTNASKPNTTTKAKKLKTMDEQKSPNEASSSKPRKNTDPHGSIKKFFVRDEDRNNNSALLTPDRSVLTKKSHSTKKKSSSKSHSKRRKHSTSDSEKSSKKPKNSEEEAELNTSKRRKHSNSDSEKPSKKRKNSVKAAELDTSWDPNPPPHVISSSDENSNPIPTKEHSPKPPASSSEEGELKKPVKIINPKDPLGLTEPITSSDEYESMIVDSPQETKKLFTLVNSNKPKLKKPLRRKANAKTKLTNFKLTPAMLNALLKTETVKDLIIGKKKMRDVNMASEVERIRQEPAHKRRKLDPEVKPDHGFDSSEVQQQMALVGLLKTINDQLDTSYEWNTVKLERYRFRHGGRFFMTLEEDMKEFVSDSKTDPETPPMPLLRKAMQTPFDNKFKIPLNKNTNKHDGASKNNIITHPPGASNDYKDGDLRNYEGIKWNDEKGKYEEVTVRSKVKTVTYGLLSNSDGTPADVKLWSQTLSRMEKYEDYWTFGILDMKPGTRSFEFKLNAEYNFSLLKTWLEGKPHEGGATYLLTKECRIEAVTEPKPKTVNKAVPKPKGAPKLAPGQWRVKVVLPLLKDDDDESKLVRDLFDENHFTGATTSIPEKYTDKLNQQYVAFTCGDDVMRQIHQRSRDYRRFNHHGNNLRLCYRLGRFGPVQLNYYIKGANILLDGQEEEEGKM